ncbi:hypothetical protein B488_00890 [Liberibacter crescens BT-1]|uniref:DNA gyrase inhibitor YacG n=1 Tax=Liberibacter crescens (strain BT-1) TaxID=1215343 RepID=L0ET18_LIBCB|nr:DNA gyrase inhibitor YacG [Liberibacter crescens]AGA64082.1 hypothetical protein B488_00890 [Liberibacter crescens BT-1]AMC12370.1 hypothetical protein RL73_00615 [Liberibacter crescens]
MVELKRKIHPCPECKKMSEYKYYPFCSERCRLLDLSRWFSGDYIIKLSTHEGGVDEDCKDIAL